MQPVKIAMLSLTHGHTRKYYQTLRDSPKLDWVAACAENETIKERFDRSVSDIPCYMSEEEMFDRHPDIEAVVLASANSEHLRQVRVCAERGVHILSMKIPTFDMAEYDEMIALIERTNLVCQVELEMHYNPVVHRIRQLVGDGEIGRIQAFQATNITLSPVWAFPWQGVPELSYGRRMPLRPNDPRFRGGAPLRPSAHFRHDSLADPQASSTTSTPRSGRTSAKTSKWKTSYWSTARCATARRFYSTPPGRVWKNACPSRGPVGKCFPSGWKSTYPCHGDQGVLMADCFGPNVYHNGAPRDRYTVQYTYFDEWIGLIDEFVDCVRNHHTPKINLRWHRKND